MASAQNILDRLIEPFFGWDIAGTYQSASQFIDFVIYLIFFISVTRFALAKRFDAKTQKPVTIIVGIALAIGMSFFGQRWGFSIGSLAPLAGLVFLVVIGMMFFNLLKSMMGSAPGAGAFAFLLIFFSITAIVPQFYQWIINKVPFIEALLSIAVIVAIFIALRELIYLIKGEGTSTTTPQDQDMEITDSPAYLKRKAKEEAARREAEKRQAEAEAAQARAEAAKTEEERKAHEKVAEVKKAEAKKAGAKAEETAKAAGGEPEVREELPDEELTELMKKVYGDDTQIAKKEIELMAGLRQHLKAIKDAMRESRKEFKKTGEKWDYEKLPAEAKHIYDYVAAFAENQLRPGIAMLNNLNIKETDNKKILKGIIAGKKIKESPLYESLIKDQKIFEKKNNLNILFITYAAGIVEDAKNKKNFASFIVAFDKLGKIIKELIHLNTKQVKVKSS